MATLRVVSWNIQKGIGTDFRRDLDRTARVLRATNADVIGLQEVLRTAATDQAALLAAPRPTHPSPLPIFALDRMAWDDALRGEVHAGPVRRASDHQLLHATLEIGSPQ